jgi:signal transduction histidine kinase
MPVYVERVSIPELINDVGQQVEQMVTAKNLTFSAEVSSTCPTVDTDKTKLKQILLNLLSNAAKFTNRGGVRVTVNSTRDSIVFEVVDTGVGIKPEEIELIWEDFRQLDQSRTRSYGGTGLGLSITRRLTQQLGGEIDVRSVFGQGTAFSVRLPRVIHSFATGNTADAAKAI